MRETGFVQHNREKWEELEKELLSKQQDPERISRLFIQITDDLSYAQTFYKNRSVRVYLNGVAQLLFNKIYRSSKVRWSSLIRFWKTSLPILIYNARREFLVSLFIFVLAAGIGALSSKYDPQFARQILGDRYVNMTLENIRNHDPMAVYKSGDGFNMFLGITFRNVYVAFRTFILGIFLGIGTIISLVSNGLMVGTFQYFFVERGFFAQSALTIWQHGTLEISCIIISGAAGLTMSQGLLFPGTYTRMQAFRISAKRGLRIMLGLIPVIGMAALIEGFFTRYTEAPDIIRISVILVSLSFVISYFVIYPRIVARKYPEQIDVADKLGYVDRTLPDISGILDDDQLFGHTLKSLKLYSSIIFGSGAVVAFLISASMTFFASKLVNISTGIIFTIRGFSAYYNYSSNPLMFAINSLAMTVCLVTAAVTVINIYNKASTFSFRRSINYRLVIDAFFTSVLINMLFFMNKGWAILIFSLALPVMLINVYSHFTGHGYALFGLGKSYKLFGKGFGNMSLLYLKFLFLVFVLLLLIRPGFYWNFLNTIRWNLNFSEPAINRIFDFMITFIFYFALYTCISTVAIAINLFFHTGYEIQFAEDLQKRIDRMGTKKVIKGYEFE